MRVAPEIIAGLCRVRERDLLRPFPGELAKVDPVKLLWAIAGVESSFGLDSAPRHESGYCYSGRYFDPKATADIGCLAHCSFGPWQVMYPHYPPGLSVFQLIPQADGSVAADLSCMAAIGVINRAISAGARSLADLVIHYNGPADVDVYARKLFACFDRPMPQYEDRVVA